MNKKLIFSFLCLLLNSSLFGEGFVSNTLVATLHGPLEPIGRIYPGLDAYSLNEQGKIDFARIVARQTSEKYLYNMIELEGGTKIFGDYDQLFYCPNRDAWVKLVELNEGEDSVYSYAKKKPLLVLSIKQVDTAICNIRTGIHRISLDKYGVYFVSKDLILVHNFAILLPSLGAIFLAHAADFAVAAGLALVTGYITEKVSEKVIPLVQNSLCSSPNVEAVSKLAAPKIDSDQKKNIPPSTPPPGNGGGPENIAKIGPILAAGEEVRKNSDPAFKAAGNVVTNVVNTGKATGDAIRYRGKAFEDFLVKNLGGKGSFKAGGREFDGSVGEVWYEAKSGQFWDMLLTNKDKLDKFRESMGRGLRIAHDNGASYHLHSNTPIPESIKSWLTGKGIPFTEWK